MSTLLTTLEGGGWEQHWNEEDGVYYVNEATREETFFIPYAYEDRMEDEWDEDDTGPQHKWINRRTGRISMEHPHPPTPETYLDLIWFKSYLSQVIYAPKTDRIIYAQLTDTILDWWFCHNTQNKMMMHPKTKIVDIVMPAITMTRVMTFRGQPEVIRNYLVVETRAPKEYTHYTESDFLKTMKLFVGTQRNVYAIIQYGLRVKFYKWEDNEGTEISKRLHLVKDVDKVMSLLEHVMENPLPLGDCNPTASDL